MAEPSSGPSPLIGGQYRVDIGRPLPEAGGGLPAYAVADRRGGGLGALMALRVTRRAPARAQALQTVFAGIEGVLAPLAYGLGPSLDGEETCYVVCAAPPGPPVSLDARPWPEAVLIEQVLRPAAAVLEALRSQGLTHRAIRPNNVFPAANNRILLGAAWAAPPAMHQPAVFEPPYVAMCHPAGRGEGQIGDDVYALGVLLVTLFLGRVPMEGMDDTAILHRKLELGDFAALTADGRLPPMLSDIVRGMVAEDPEHRPPPALLRDPVAARGRRVAARPPVRAARPFLLGAFHIWNNRTLALAMAREPAAAAAALRAGTVMYWLRRGLGDAVLAVKLEELARFHAQGPAHARDQAAGDDIVSATLMMRAIAAADALMPLCWRDTPFWPDGLGSLLAVARDTPFARSLHDLLTTEAIATWAAMREERVPSAAMRLEARQWRAVTQARGLGNGLWRLLYTLNPLLPCASPVLGERWIAEIEALPPALDAIVAAAPDTDPMEPHLIAFLAARSRKQLDQEIKTLSLDGEPADRLLSLFRLLSELQNRFHPAPLRALAAWTAARSGPVLERWRNLARRAAVEERLAALAAAGSLPPMLSLLDDGADQAADAEGLRAALAELAALDGALQAVSGGGRGRAANALRIGQELAAVIGLTAAVTMLLLSVFRQVGGAGP